MFSVSVSIDPKQLADVRSLLDERQFKRAMQAAVSDTVRTGTALIARRIGEEVKLKIGDIKKTITSKRGSYDKPVGSITIQKDKAVWLTQFMTAAQATPKLKRNGEGFVQKQRKGGIRVSVRRKAQPGYPTQEVHPKAFVTYGFSPKAGAFERFGEKKIMKAGRHKGKRRQRIRRKRGPTPFGVFVNARGEQGAKTVLEEATKTLAATLAKNLDSQLSRFLNPRANDKVANA